MTYKEKLTFIQEKVNQVNGGKPWDALQSELKQISGLYQKDIDDINRKVVKAVEETHGTRIYNALMANEEHIGAEGLEDSIFQKILTRQQDTVRNTIKNRIARDLANGVPAAQALATHHHSLLTEEDLHKAVNKAKARLMAQAEEASNRNPLNLVLGILFLVGGIALTAASGGQAIFYGAILVGLINIVKFAIG